MAKDLYEILGVQRGASEQEIKQAYRKLSRELHPDKHKGDKDKEAKFKEVNAAYEVLSDPKKKQMYDQFGDASTQGGFGGGGFGGFGGMNAEDILRQFSGFGDIFSEMMGGGGRRQQEEPVDEVIPVRLHVSFKDFAKGVDEKFHVDVVQQCTECNGKRAAPGSKMKKCPDCDGKGTVIRGNSIFQIRTPCNKCKAKGEIPETPCPKCKGDGRIRVRKNVTIHIPKGASITLDDEKAEGDIDARVNIGL